MNNIKKHFNKLLITILIITSTIGINGCGTPNDPIGDIYSSNIYPAVSNTYDIGSLTYQYNTAYFEEIYLNGTSLDSLTDTGRSVTYMVAASDAPDYIKEQADYVCGDGTYTYDVEYILAAIDSCPEPSVVYTNMIEGGSTILLSMGTFNITSPIIINQPAITLTGMGTAVTTLKAVTNLNDNIIEFDSSLYVNGLYQTYIQDLTIDGDKTNQSTSGTGIDFSGARASYFQNIQILHCKDYGFYADAAVKACDFITFENCYVVSCSKGSFYSTGANNQLWFNNCYSLLVGDNYYAWALNGSQGIYITNCTYDGGSTGQGSAINLTHSNNVYISNSYFYGIGGAQYAVNMTNTTTTMNTISITNCLLDAEEYGTAFYLYGTGLSNIVITNNVIKGNYNYVIAMDSWTSGRTFYDFIIKDNIFDSISNYNYVYNSGDITLVNSVFEDNTHYIASGEIRTASGILTAGNANSIAFAWHNSEQQDILIKKVVIYITTAGGTAGSLLDVGIADNASGTNRGTEFFNDIDLNTSTIVDSTIVIGGGNQTVWVFCQDTASATDGWVVGQILTANAASLVGSYYIEYVGI